MNFPQGTEVTIPFAFLRRALTKKEEAAFEAGNGLPTMTGYDPPHVTFEYRDPDAVLHTASVQKDGTGEYHAQITLTKPARYKGHATATGAENEPLVVTRPVSIRSIPF